MGRAFPWGDRPVDGTQCNFARPPADLPPTTPVCAFAPNGYGLHDMVGNVWQWCSNEFQPYPGSPADLPGTLSVRAPYAVDLFAGCRARRGGSWNVIQPFRLRCANRGAVLPDMCVSNIGFRCAATSS